MKVYDLKNLEVSGAVKICADFLLRNEGASIPNGKYDVGRGIHLNVMEYTTRPFENGKWEAHREYADLQILLEGEETVYVSDIRRMKTGSYDPEKDYLECQGPYEHSFILQKNMGLLLLPEDAHMPSIGTNNTCAKVKKAVFKIPVSAFSLKRSMEIPILGEFDVVVCGGGVAGFIAAISAARNGAKTALIEQYGFLGGTATAGLVSPISEINMNGRKILGGIPEEFVQKLLDAGMARYDLTKNNICFDQEYYKLIAQQMVVEAGVTLFLHSYVTGIEKQGNHISHVYLVNKSGNAAISAKTYIDCTGDGDVANYAGVALLQDGSDLQPMTLWIKLGGVDTAAIVEADRANQSKRRYIREIHERLLDIAKHSKIPNFGGPWVFPAFHEGIVDVNITRTSADASNAADLSRAEMVLREDAFTLTKLLKENFSAFRNCYLLQTGVQAGIRESRRIKGRYTVSVKDLLSGRHYADAIAMGCHCVDVHRPDSAEQDVQFLTDPYYIPYYCMIAENVDNLIVAGRCVSALKEAQAAMRVQGVCMAQGQAAGCAAALCAAYGTGVADINIKQLQNCLIKQGAIL